MENLLNIDIEIFKLFNQVLINPFLDFLMPLITKEKNIVPVYIVALVLLVWKGGRKGRIVAAILVVTAIVSDQVSSNFLKSYFGRLRPCQELIDVRLLINCGSGKSFPSSHAVNNFAAAMVLSWHYKRYSAIFFSVAAMVAFSRVYCGVHYPSDIIGGTIIGCLMGFLMIYVYKKLSEKYTKIKY